MKNHLSMCVGGSSSMNTNFEQRTIPEMFSNFNIPDSEMLDEISNKEKETTLLEMFPGYSLAKINSAILIANTIEEAVDLIMGSETHQEKEMGLEELLSNMQKNQSIEGLYNLKIFKRDNLWREGLTFYKLSLADCKMLKKEFRVEFEDELGIDAGAIMIEFFSKMFAHAEKELFESVKSTPYHFIPKRSAGNLVLFKIVGIAIGHCILQRGPPFGILAPWCFLVLCEEDEDFTYPHISIEDVPLNAGTSNLIQFFQKLQLAESDEEIDALFDSEEGPAFEELVNGSQWDISTKVSKINRETLLSMLVYEELVTKREKQLKAMREGLRFTGIYNYIKENQDFFRSTFIGTDTPITSAMLMAKIDFDTCVPVTEMQHSILDWFRKFILDSDVTYCKMFLKFCTGFTKIPVLTPLEISIDFMSDEEGIYPKSAVCSKVIRLPTVHKSIDDFISAIKKGLEMECEGFYDY